MSLLGSVGSFAGGLLDDTLGGSLGDYIPGVGDARAQERANALNVSLAKENRDWMERMSNTAYARAMTDMRKAGLNPLLAYQQGGASVPSSNAPIVEAASKTKFADAALGAYSGISAAQSQRQQANTAQAQSESTIALQGAQTANTVAQVEKTQAETQKTIDSIKNQKVRRQLESAQIPLAKIKETAADLARKGTERLDKIGDHLLKNVAKPSMNPRTLEYENPILKGFKNFFSGPKDDRLIKGK